MQRKFAAVGAAVLSIAVAGAYAKKKIEPAVPQLTGDERILHALNRLTFGPRSGDFEAVKAIGIDRWIEQQLHPHDIPENPVLAAKLAPLDTLGLSNAELARRYPTPPMIRAMIDGRLPLPTDPEQRMLVQKLAAKFEQRQAAGAQSQQDAGPRINLASLTIDDRAKDVLENGNPPERLLVLESLTPEQQLQVLDILPGAELRRLYNFASPELRRKIQVFRAPMQVVTQDLTEGKLLRAVYSNRQLEEVLTDFWYNHFNVYLDKGADRVLVTAYEREAIRPHVLGHFKDLLLATAQSPAMLFYLDNWQSAGPDVHSNPNQKRRRGLNENYARELMELHTLGVDGGYTQQDVTEVARCFTGWTIREPQRGGAFDFNERLHDNGEKHVLGSVIPPGGGMEDGLKVIDILARHPSTARFISGQLATRFVSDDPPPALVDRMARAFLATDGDLREVMRAMIHSPEFWDPTNFRSKVKSPLEMVASAIRAVNGDVDYAQALGQVMNQLGEPLYRKQEPTGYSNRGADWMNSASLLARMNFATALANNKIPGVKVDTSRFNGDVESIERGILQTAASPNARAAIEAGLAGRQTSGPPDPGPLVAGLALGSPDFQRR